MKRYLQNIVFVAVLLAGVWGQGQSPYDNSSVAPNFGGMTAVGSPPAMQQVASLPPQTPYPPVGETVVKGGDVRFDPGTLSTKVYYEGSETLGRVGHETILKRDILHQIKKHAYMTYLRYLEEMPEAERTEKGPLLKRQIFEEFLASPKIYSDILDSYIKKLLFYNDFVVSRPKDQIQDQTKRLIEAFERDYLPGFMKEVKVTTRKELEQFFQDEIQSSVAQDQRIFIHETIGGSWLEFNLGEDQFEPNTVDLRRYYESHLDLYKKEERVQWEAMTVLFTNHPSRVAAHQKIARMGNAVLVARTPDEESRLFTEVAKSQSEDFFATSGGSRDWTRRGVLQSKIIEETIFSEDLPEGELSKILEDSSGFTIVRVIKRERGCWTPFVQVQEDVRKRLLADRREAMIDLYEDALSKRFTIELFNMTPAERKAHFESSIRSTGQSVTGRDMH